MTLSFSGFRASGKPSAVQTDDSRIIFLFGFAKNERANVSAREQTALSANAQSLVSLNDLQIADLIKRAAIIELECDT